jgi:hypothetical protein
MANIDATIPAIIGLLAIAQPRLHSWEVAPVPMSGGFG